jgi:hypothetical protein
MLGAVLGLIRAVVVPLVEVLADHLASDRWVVLPVVPGARRTVQGLALGRRFARAWGGCVVLALRPDGTYRPVVVAVEGRPAPAGEAAARAACVDANRRRFPRADHKFSPSPVWDALCVECAKDAIEHDRVAVADALARAVAPATIASLVFVGTAAKVARADIADGCGYSRDLLPAERARAVAAGVVFADVAGTGEAAA